MNVLITGAASPLGQTLAAELGENHSLRLTDRSALDTDLDFVRSELGHDESTEALVRGIDAIIHQTHRPAADEQDFAWLDYNTRCTYNLLLAASTADVGRVVLLSTLDLFAPYDEDMTVGENWRPRPSCEPGALGPHLAECVAREFAHTHALNILVLRLGHVVRAAEVRGRKFDPMWVEERDVSAALAKILDKNFKEDGRRDISRYGVLHLQSASERARFSSERIQRFLDFEPRYRFEEAS